MQEKNFPKSYKGYETAELLEMWDQMAGDGITPGTPVEKIRAMSRFLRDYKLGIHDVALENGVDLMNE